VAPVFRKKADSLQEIDAVQKGEAMITELQFLTPEELGQRRDRRRMGPRSVWPPSPGSSPERPGSSDF
jgi:hypothetical protein